MSITGEAAYEADTPKVRPSRVWFWVFGGLVALSLIGAAAIWIAGQVTVASRVEAFARFLAPGTAELRFKRAGQYTLYYEYRGELDGQPVDASPSPPPGIELDIKDDAGQSLELRRTGQEFRYDAGGFEAVSLRRVIIPRPGVYRLTVVAPASERFAISVGRGATPSTDPFKQAALLVGIIGSLLGVAGLVTVGVLRSRSRAGIGALAAQPAAPPTPAPVPAVVTAGSILAPPRPDDEGGPAVPDQPPPARPDEEPAEPATLPVPVAAGTGLPAPSEGEAVEAPSPFAPPAAPAGPSTWAPPVAGPDDSSEPSGWSGGALPPPPSPPGS